MAEKVTDISINGLNEAELKVLRPLIYHQIFNYPLLEKEVFQFSQWSAEDYSGFSSTLNSLCDSGLIQSHDGYFGLKEIVQNTARRIKGNKSAIPFFKKARKMSGLMSVFPYIRAVGLSGSLSKGFIGEDGDIDYFIITEPGRLWLARTILILYKKIFLLNSRKYFCVNYFIDTNHMEIPDQNLFTATEASTLLPTFGFEHFQSFQKENPWVLKYLPNHPSQNDIQVVKARMQWLKKTAEWFLNNRIGDWLDEWCMRTTVKHWQKKFSHFDEETVNLALRSRKYISKHHPRNFQKRVLERFQEISKEIELKLKEKAVPA